MAWTDPVDPVAGVTLLSAANQINYVHNNIRYLGNGRPLGVVDQDAGAADYSLTNAAWTAVDTTNCRVSMTIGLNSARVLALACFSVTGAQDCFFDIGADGTTNRFGGTNGMAHYTASQPGVVTMIGTRTGLTAGSHTFDLLFKNPNAAITVKRNGYPIYMIILEC